MDAPFQIPEYATVFNGLLCIPDRSVNFTCERTETASTSRSSLQFVALFPVLIILVARLQLVFVGRVRVDPGRPIILRRRCLVWVTAEFQTPSG